MTNLIEPRTLPGFRDFLPAQAIVRNYVIAKMKKVFESFGFDPLETPTLEFADILTGKYGAEADKLLYLFEDLGQRKIGLRYDQTVPTSRVVAQYQNLPRPFKRYQIQPVWRQEKPQRGRYREFMQCDADIYSETLTSLSDAEPIALINATLKNLGFTNFLIKINDRQILFEIMEKSGVERDKYFSAIQSIDKLDKKSEEEIRVELAEKYFPNKVVDNIFEQIALAQPNENLLEIFSLLESMGVDKNSYKFEPTLSRGLDYYTGVIYEAVIPDYKSGSVVGGGRYDNLIAQFTGKQISGTGFAFGFDRLIEALEALNLLPMLPTNSKVLVTIFSRDLLANSLTLTAQLRDNNINCEIYPDVKAKLDKQLKYADAKGIPFVIIIGPDEAVKNVVTLKNLRTKSQSTGPLQKMLKLIRE